MTPAHLAPAPFTAPFTEPFTEPFTQAERSGLYDAVQARLYPGRRYAALTRAERRALTAAAVEAATATGLEGFTPEDDARARGNKLAMRSTRPHEGDARRTLRTPTPQPEDAAA